MNYPRTDCEFSPAQLLMGRRLRGAMWGLPSLFAEGSDQRIYSKRIEKRVDHYDKYSRGVELPDFCKNEVVKVQDPKTKKWDKSGIIKKIIRNRKGRSSSYEILVDGETQYHRNKRFLRKTKSSKIEESSSSSIQGSKSGESNNKVISTLKKESAKMHYGMGVPKKHREHREAPRAPCVVKGRSLFPGRKRRCHGAFSLKRKSTVRSSKTKKHRVK